MIELTFDSAALFAQVLPVLTLAVLLEGRTPLSEYKRADWAAAVEAIRFVAVLYGTGGTMFCLFTYATKREPTWVDDLFITGGFWLVAGAMLLLTVQMCLRPFVAASRRSFKEADERSERRNNRR